MKEKNNWRSLCETHQCSQANTFCFCCLASIWCSKKKLFKREHFNLKL